MTSARTALLDLLQSEHWPCGELFSSPNASSVARAFRAVCLTDMYLVHVSSTGHWQALRTRGGCGVGVGVGVGVGCCVRFLFIRCQQTILGYKNSWTLRTACIHHTFGCIIISNEMSISDKSIVIKWQFISNAYSFRSNSPAIKQQQQNNNNKNKNRYIIPNTIMQSDNVSKIISWCAK